MGAKNVKAAYERWGPHLAGRPAAMVALIVMANTSRDRDEPPEYFGGPDPIALALGLGGSERTRAKRVSEHVCQLIEVGAVQVARRGGHHWRTRYRLVLDGPGAGTRPAQGGQTTEELAPLEGERSRAATSPNAPHPAGHLSPLSRTSLPTEGGREEEEEEERAGAPPAPTSSSVGGAQQSARHEQDARPAPVATQVQDGPDEMEEFDPFVAEHLVVPGDEPATPGATTSPAPVRQVHVWLVPGARFAYLRPTGDGRTWLKSHNLPAFWSRTLGAFVVRPDRLADLVTMARHEGWMVHEHDTEMPQRRRTR
jgi:hypothetical protein